MQEKEREVISDIETVSGMKGKLSARKEETKSRIMKNKEKVEGQEQA